MVDNNRDMPKWGTPARLGLEIFRSISGVVNWKGFAYERNQKKDGFIEALGFKWGSSSRQDC